MSMTEVSEFLSHWVGKQGFRLKSGVGGSLHFL